MTRAIQLLIAQVTVLGVLSGPVEAEILYSMAGTGLPQDHFRTTFTYGFDFTPVQDITVDSLGYYDWGQDGLTASHKVGIWTTSGILLESTTVTTANSTLSGPVFHGGQFRFTPIAGLNLDAGTTYRFGASTGSPAADLWISAGIGVSHSPSLATVELNPPGGSGGYYIESEFTLPTNRADGWGGVYHNGSLTASVTAIPEPTAISLSTIVAFGLFARYYRRRIVHKNIDSLPPPNAPIS